MKNFSMVGITWAGVILFVQVLIGCHNTTPVAFYTLNGWSPHPANLINPMKRDDLSVGIGAVHLPDYLDRPQIVTRRGISRLHLSEFHRWAGPLDGEIIQVMMRHLSTLLGTSQVVRFPWRQSEIPQFRLEMQFHHFEGILGEKIRMKGIWHLTSTTSNEQMHQQPFHQSIPVTGPEYEDLVVAFGQGLRTLSEQISAVVQQEVEVSTHN